MSQLYLKRQFIRSEIRKKEIDNHLRFARKKMLYTSNNEPTNEPLTQELLDYLYNQMGKQDDSPDSCLNFLKTILEKRTDTLNKAFLFAKVKNILNYLSGQEEQEIAKDLVKQLCERVAFYAESYWTFLQPCFREFIELISDYDLQMVQFWTTIALIRNEVFYCCSFEWFLSFIKILPDTEKYVDIIVETLLNFTMPMKTKEQSLTLKVTQLMEISGIMQNLMNNFQFGEKDLHHCVFIFENIVKLCEKSDIGFEIIQINNVSKLFLHEIELCLEQKKSIRIETIVTMVNLIGQALGGSPKNAKQIVDQNKNLIPTLLRLLPLSVGNFTQPIFRPVKWIHKNVQITCSAMLSLCNLATIEEINMYLLINAFKPVIQLSAFPNNRIKSEVAIFIWNMLITGDQQKGELHCENDSLYAVNNILHSDFSSSTFYYCLKFLKNLINLCPFEKDREPYEWKFSRERICGILQQNGTYTILEQLCANPDHEISQLAAESLNLLP